MKLEMKLVRFLEKKKHVLFFLAITFLALTVRVLGRNYISRDFTIHLYPWFTEIVQNGRWDGLGIRVGEYNVLYQTLMTLMTYIPMEPFYQLKLLSVFFDFLMALICAEIAITLKFGSDSSHERYGYTYLMTYAIIVLSIPVIFNSAWWGQCDSMYSTFLLLFLLSFYKEEKWMPFVWLGLALACKLQTIFLLPFVVCAYFYRKNFSITKLGITVLVFWLTGIFAYFKGRPLLEPFLVYWDQTHIHPLMYMGIHSFWVIFDGDFLDLYRVAICITIGLLGMYFFAVLYKKTDLSKENMFVSAVWCIWTCVLFLPAMHERYTYPLDLCLILLAIYNRKYLKYAFVSNLLSIITYSLYLFGKNEVTLLGSIIYFAAWLDYTVRMCTSTPEKASLFEAGTESGSVANSTL